MKDFIQFALQGFPIGCVFALLAVGLVLNYKTSGVFNLAFAAQAYVSAVVYFEIRKVHQWPLIPAGLVAIILVGPVLGWVLDRALYRHQRTATPLAKLVTSLGLLIAIPEITKLIFGAESKKNAPPLWWVKRSDQWIWYPGKSLSWLPDWLVPPTSTIYLNASGVSTVAATAVAVLGLTLLFRYSALGLRMRAVVESPRLVQLQGIDAEKVARRSWMLSSMLAALAGVLIAPLSAGFTSFDFFQLLIAALAATVFANLVSIPRALIGGIALGVLGNEITGFLNKAINDSNSLGKTSWQSIVADGLRPSLPFIILFVLLIVKRDLRRERAVSDPLSGVDPPPPTPAALGRPAWMSRGSRAFGTTVCVVLFLLCWFTFDNFWLGLFVGGFCLATQMLSIIVTSGIGGTISLCQSTFAVIGAFTTAQVVERTGMSVLLAIFIGAGVAAVVGGVLALPVVRLPAIYAALATLAFALMFEAIIVPQRWASGGDIPVKVPRPVIGSIDFADNRYFGLLVAVLLAAASFLVIALRNGTTGRFLDAVRGSEAGAAAIGINASRQRLVAFTVGAAIAGLGGGMMAMFRESANYKADFTYFFSLVFLVMVISAGSRSVQAAITSGIGFFVVPELINRLFIFLNGHWDFVQPKWSQGVAFILFGFGAFTYAKHPEGMIEYQTVEGSKKTIRLIERITGRQLEGIHDPTAQAATEPELAEAVAP